MPMRRYRAVAYPGPALAAAPAVTTPDDAATIGTVPPYLLALMLRNASSAGFPVADPMQPGSFSAPGCIIASPSYQEDLASVDQDYVFNWTRDAAITAMELAAAGLPTVDGICQPLADYLGFAARCQENTPSISRACYTIEGEPRPWTDQSDGPALQTSALLQALPQIGTDELPLLQQVIGRNVDVLLAEYQQPTYNLWEEVSGYSFFARSVQLQCFEDLIANTAGITVPGGAAATRDQLRASLDEHWNGTVFVSVLDGADPPNPVRPGYDPNIDIVLAALYGGISCLDPRILATAAQLRQQWSDPASPVVYPINLADAARGIGPLLGRYPGDTYDGDVDEPVAGGHPWALCTAAFADLYYRVAAGVTAAGGIPTDALATPFLQQIGVAAATSTTDAAGLLVAAGDRMLDAVLFHSDHLELSEQFDGTTGYEKSVSNLTWSYASFLRAARSRSRAVA